MTIAPFCNNIRFMTSHANIIPQLKVNPNLYSYESVRLFTSRTGAGRILSISQIKRRHYSYSNQYFKVKWGFRLMLVGLGATCFTCMVISKAKTAAHNKEVSCSSPSNSSTEVMPKAPEEKYMTLSDAIRSSEDLLFRIKDEVGAPGIAVGVSIDGKETWKTGIGYADVENRVPCTGDTVMRIASISKPMTMAIIAKLWEQGKLDIDAPITKYLKDWPDKAYAGKQATITTRQLVSHLGGIRHYEKDCGKKKKVAKEDLERKAVTNRGTTDDSEETASKSGSNKNESEFKADTSRTKTKASEVKTGTNEGNSKEGSETKSNTIQQSTTSRLTAEFEMKEFYIKEKYNSVTSSLKLFKDDALCSLPGAEYLYTTHGYTLVSAIAEAAAGEKFADMAKTLFSTLGLEYTYLDENDPIIYNRARYYVKSKTGRLRNAPYVDNSYKWAGGGFISTVGDLLQFGNAMLYSYQHKANDTGLPGYLKSETMRELWSPCAKTKGAMKDEGFYGMGWFVMPKVAKYGNAKNRNFYVSHTGGAIGASSVLLVLPRNPADVSKLEKLPPQGITVAIITNMQAVNLHPVAFKIAQLFERVGDKQEISKNSTVIDNAGTIVNIVNAPK